MMYRSIPKSIFFAALSLVLLFLVSGCYESGLGIFYSLEIERKLEDYSLENNLTIGAMAKAGSNYYVAASTVYRRGDTETNWEAISPPDGFNLSTSLAELDGSIYACYYNTAGTEYALFKLSGDTWTKVTDADVANAAKVVAVDIDNDGTNDYLIVSNRVSSTEYSYWYSAFADPTNFATTNLPPYSSPITDVASDGNIVVALQDVVYRDNGGIPTSFTATTAAITTTGVGGLFVPAASGILAATTLFASTKEGKVFYTTDSGVTWTEMDGTSSYDLTDMVLATTSGTEEVLLVGTQGNGYMEAVVESGDGAGDLEWKIIDRNSLSTDQNYLNTELSKAPVLGFYYDSGKDFVFALTAGNGLWRNSQETSYRTWNIE